MRKLPITTIKRTALPSDEPDNSGQVIIITNWSRGDVAYIINPKSIRKHPNNPILSTFTLYHQIKNNIIFILFRSVYIYEHIFEFHFALEFDIIT